MRDVSKKPITQNIENIRDLSDFCENWFELKELISDKNITRSNLDVETKQLVSWLRLLADRTCTLETE